jgi:hypothetical protein
MLQAIVVDIPRKKLKDYKNYVGYLFRDENGVYNVCTTEEDVMKSNQWFKNLPKEVYIVDTDNTDIKPGDKIFGVATNEELHNKIFVYVGPTNKIFGMATNEELHNKIFVYVGPTNKIFGMATNEELHNKIFVYVGPTKGGVDICDFKDENNKLVISTKTFLEGSHKFVRMADKIDKQKIVDLQSTHIFSF